MLKVAGHRLSNAEVESALVSHPKVAEAAVIGKPDEVKGEVIVAFVILRTGNVESDELKKELVKHVRSALGPVASPEAIYFVNDVPKTRSGKIMRRVIKAKALGNPPEIFPLWPTPRQSRPFRSSSERKNLFFFFCFSYSCFIMELRHNSCRQISENHC